MDFLHEFLPSTSSDFDVIAITETSQRNNDFLKINVAIKGYNNYFTSSFSEKGSVAICTKDKLNSFERTDLRQQNVDFVSIWIEIKNKNSKNIICGCLYRHPCHDLSEFLQYLEKCLKIIAKENKEVYICGDFNIDLLQIETIHSNQEYYNLLSSYGFLPQIIQTTRVAENQSPSLIDNIFQTISMGLQVVPFNFYLSKEKKMNTNHKMCIFLESFSR